MASAGALRWHDIVSGAATSAAVDSGLNPEILLQEDYNQELYDLFGVAVKWYPINYNTNKDVLHGEDTLKSWASAASPLDLLLEIEPEVDAWTPYGIVPQEMIVCRGSSRDFRKMEFTSAGPAAITGHDPVIGDLVLFIYNGLLYEVIDVDRDRETMGTFNFLNWKMTLKRFMYSDEDSTNLPTNTLPLSGFGTNDAPAISAESNTIIDYDDDDTLNDDIYGRY